MLIQSHRTAPLWLCLATVSGFLGLDGGVTLWGKESGRTAEKSAPDVVIYRGSYPGWPWIARTPSAKLLCVWREGDVHEFSDVGKLMLSASDDGGKSWSSAKTILDVPQIDDRNVAIVCLSETQWLVSYNSLTRAGVSRTWVMRTDDAGTSWSTPILVLDEDARTKAAIVPLANGDLLLPYYRGSGEECLVGISPDKGRTWTTHAIPNAPGFVGDEWDLVEFPDGKLVGILRNNAPAPTPVDRGWFYKTESRDHGRTWTSPVRTNLQDSRSTSPAQLFLHHGRPVVLYSNARKVSVVMATTDDPQLVTWKVDRLLPCYFYRSDKTPIADGSYPVSVPVSAHQRFVVDYVHDGDSKTISGYLVDLSGFE
ncbi:MAG: sialidase family protein [Planctomycetota bacterium]|nr:sialidase family protein [Planctomycetota bacterium]MDA1178672.1 sialidase family protein [Planctomycetota bacterium]